jgi:hypothetical protein
MTEKLAAMRDFALGVTLGSIILFAWYVMAAPLEECSIVQDVETRIYFGCDLK